MDYESTVDCIKSCIISVKGGLPLNSLAADFRNQTGKPLKPEQFGYLTIKDLLIDIEEIHLSGNILSVRDKKTDHLSKLISKQKGQTKIKVGKKPASLRFAESRLAHALIMKRGAPRSLREKSKKLEALKDNCLLPETSAISTRNLLDDRERAISRQQELYSGCVKSEIISSFGSNSVSVVGIASSLGAGSISLDDRPVAGKVSAGRGRGRGRVVLQSSEAPGGLSGSASPRRETSSPDIRSVASESISKGGGPLSTSSKSETTEPREPMLFQYQLVGDNFLAKVASLIVGVTKEPTESRLCCSSLDIATCLKRTKRSSAFPDKVIVLLGLTDIMKGQDLESMQPLMLELLERLHTQTKEVVVMTVPVPICLKKMLKPLRTLRSYNEWLLTLKVRQTRVVDLLPYIQNDEMETLPFLCESSKLDGWNESACWAFVEALFFEDIKVSNKQRKNNKRAD